MHRRRLMKTAAAGAVATGLAGASELVAGPKQSVDIYHAILAEKGEATPNISTEELRTILADQSATALDVRSFAEYAVDHIPGAINVAQKPGTTKDEYVSDIAEIGRIVGADKAAPMVLYCNGPHCGKSKRVANELVEAGYTNVTRYQLGMPVWRALIGLTEIELEGVQHVAANDRTAVFIDVRSSEEFEAGSLPNARSIPHRLVEAGKGGGEVKSAKKDGRLPMEDHNTRIIVFGHSGSHAEHVASALAKNAFSNISYYPGAFETLNAARE